MNKFFATALVLMAVFFTACTGSKDDTAVAVDSAQ
jgi:hypothetical protein